MEQIKQLPYTTENYLVDSFSADNFCEDKERINLEKKYSNFLEITDKFNRQSVSYQLSKKDVLHNWLKYKEGFSADLVSVLLDEMHATVDDWIMDPFMGSGTTALVCQQRGINSIGYDIMPISNISIQAKAAVLKYNVSEIQQMISDIKNLNIPSNYNKKTAYVTITQDAYPEETEKYLSYITEWRDNSHYSDITKNLLTLCIINSLERISYTIKSGQYLGWDCRSLKVINANIVRKKKGQKLLPQKHVREIIADAKNTILDELHHVLRDIKYIQSNTDCVSPAEIRFVQNSALYELPELESDFLRGVITSPPYCNRYDYTRTYALELVFLGLGEKEIKELRQSLLSCTVESRSKMDELREHYKKIGQENRFKRVRLTIDSNKAFHEILNALLKRKDNGDLNNNGIIRMVEGYFTELAFIYAELYRVCKKGATVAFVNDNVRYGGEVIPVDFLSCSLAEQFGFTVKKVYCLKQQKGNSSQQMARFGRVPLRKSITIWEKT